MPRSPLSKDQALQAIPVPSADIRLQITPQGFVRISYPLQLKPWITRFFPRNISLPMRTLELDSMGSFVWSNIDGKKSVLELAERVREHYQCHRLEAEHSVAEFVRQLGRRGILGLQ